jgi:hypothetical protein
MKTFYRLGLVLLVFAHFNSGSFAQSGIISTYAGPGLPANGAQATTQALDIGLSVVPDGAGGIFVAMRKPK